ncbi:hypothetical protein [Treponema phagedenis]|uniref:hypothetical protein n=1 Tax=Treponema phagedenis TaxID=162 RepID=UPI00197D1ABA|nr:hypothetical protein [Treponema phagedenis]
MAKAVLGATSAVVGITTKIMGAIRRKNAAYSAEQREKMKNFNQKVQEGIGKLSAEQVKSQGTCLKHWQKLLAEKTVNR